MKQNFELREWRLSDAASLAENANNIHIWNNVRDYFPYPYSEEDGKQFIEMVSGKPKPAEDFAIVVDGKAVGGIGIVLQKIYAPVFDFNIASQKVLQKVGFEREAILKSAAIKNEKIIDLHYCSLLKSQWASSVRTM